MLAVDPRRANGIVGDSTSGTSGAAFICEFHMLRRSLAGTALATTSGRMNADVDVALGENGDGEFGTLLGGVGKLKYDP